MCRGKTYRICKVSLGVSRFSCDGHIAWPCEQKFIKNKLPRLLKVAIDLTVVKFRSTGSTQIISKPPFGLSSRGTLFPLGPPRHNDLRLRRIGKDVSEYVAVLKSISFVSVLRYRTFSATGFLWARF